jgi:serine phosphatase RsbU (regulator of sigma subunit)
MQVLVVNPPEGVLPRGTLELVRESGWQLTPAADYHAAIEAASTGTIDAVILPEPEHGSQTGMRDFEDLMRLIDARRTPALMVTEKERVRPADPRSLVHVVDPSTTLAELRGRLAMMEKYQGLVVELERELANMERLSQQLNQHFRDVDEEMRLAARLQRDFLPNLEEPIGGMKFASLFCPASWVSGDMFDVLRIDEDTTGLYIADAVGHGMAASLLTMFIKRSVISKRVEGERQAVVCPSEVMTTLNGALTEQSLPSCQFVTACYGLIDHGSLTLRFARGGHPHPVLVRPGGISRELKTPGGLLGIFQEAEFPTYEAQLAPGDKLLLYSDGLETVLSREAGSGDTAPPCETMFGPLSELAIDEMLEALARRLGDADQREDTRDDATILGLEVLRR